jgi:hypothetical protein
MMPLKVTTTPHFLILFFNNSKMADIESSEVAAIATPFSLAQQWVRIGRQ